MITLTQMFLKVSLENRRRYANMQSHKWNITLVVAMDRNRAIGVGSKIPWRLPKEQQYFKSRTTGRVVVMGRETWESLPSSVRPLRWRTNVVLSRNKNFSAEGAFVETDWMTILERADRGQLNMIIGGEEIYKLFLPYSNRLLVTVVDTETPGADKFFPEIDSSVWRETLLRTEEDLDRVTGQVINYGLFEYHKVLKP